MISCIVGDAGASAFVELALSRSQGSEYRLGPSPAEPKMRTRILAGITGLVVANPLAAHFLYIVPTPSGGHAAVYNDTPKPDPLAGWEAFEKVTFTRVDAAGAVASVSPTVGRDGTLTIDGTAAQVYGSVPYAVVLRGEPHPILLTYHAKAVTAGATVSPVGTSLELTPVKVAAGVAFLVTANGQPVSGQEVLVLLPGESKPSAVRTGADGRTPSFEKPGAYAARTHRSTLLPKDEEFRGRKYRISRDYATVTTSLN